MRTWSVCRAVLFVAAAALLACNAETPEEMGGFEGDERPTFQAADPYEQLDRIEWRAWSEETISGSKKPILLDLSSLWCHYCHLYDSAVWSDARNAKFISENFTPVHVDADARPDIDARYNEGGLPTVVVLTPDGYPVGGTSFDLEGLGAFLRATMTRYEQGGDSLRQALETTVAELARRQSFLVEQGELDPGVLSKVIAGVSRAFDRDFGGFRSEGTWVRFVGEEALYSLIADVDPSALETSLDDFLKLTLDRMDEGAVHDQLFGGFFRATDDRAWTAPHFEKLLEVQAWIADAYLAAYERWEDERYRAVAERTIEFALEFFGNPDGVTFANSMDSDLGPYDVGGFYTWSVADVDSLLTGNEAAASKLYFGIAPSGDIPEREDQNTLFVNATMERLAERLQTGVATAEEALESAKARMRAARLAGRRPRIDSRAFAAPNLRMAVTLARASDVLENETYGDRARAVVDFFTAPDASSATSGDAGVPHVFDGISRRGPDLFENQVAAIEACLAVHSLTDDVAYLDRARQMAGHVAVNYRNELSGSYWDTPLDATGPGLLMTKVRSLEANTRLASALMDITERTGDSEARQEAERILKSFSVSFGSKGLSTIPYAAAVHRLFWNLRGKSS